MINGNIINGNTINGDSFIYKYLTVNEIVKINESESFKRNFGLNLNENIFIHDQQTKFFNKGIPENEGLKISESVIIELGNFVMHIEDEPVHTIESLSFDLQKEVLMDEYIEYYVNLLIMQYRNKTKAVKHITAIVKAALIDLLPSILQNSFSIDSAQGPQLDILGKYIGISRKVNSFTSFVVLSDIDYRLLLKIKIATNNLGSSFLDIQDFINNNLSGTLKAFDHKDMSMSFFMSSQIISQTLAQVIVQQDLLPRPMGVGSSAIVYLSSTTNVFGFRSYSFDSLDQVGFNTYSNYNTEYQFLKYEDTP